MATFSQHELRFRAFLRVATFMRSMWEEDGRSDTRLLDRPWIPDEYVVVGTSVRGTECREHVVPRLVLCNRCLEMFAAGATTEDVADFLSRHLRVVLISKEERALLDSSAGLNLRQRMPEGWDFSEGDAFARLRLAGIEYRELAPNNSFKPNPLRSGNGVAG